MRQNISYRVGQISVSKWASPEYRTHPAAMTDSTSHPDAFVTVIVGAAESPPVTNDRVLLGGGQKFPAGSDRLRWLDIGRATVARKAFGARICEFSDFPARYDAPGSLAGHRRGV